MTTLATPDILTALDYDPPDPCVTVDCNLNATWRVTVWHCGLDEATVELCSVCTETVSEAAKHPCWHCHSCGARNVVAFIHVESM